MDYRIPVFTDDPGWHGKRLKEVFAARGYEAVFISLKDCAFNIGGNGQPAVLIPGFENGLPKGVFVRGVPGGTLQQVIARLDVLHALKLLGVVVYNDGRAVERTVDKAMTSFLLHLNQVPTPQTWVCESRHQAHDVYLRETMAGRPLVIKPLFGSQGQGVRKLTRETPFPVPMEEHVDGLYYLQSYIDSGEGAWHDHRVFVIRGHAVAAMIRHGSHWVNNVAQGGRCEVITAEGELAQLAEAAARAVSVDYCGVDIIRGRDGRPYVLEVNSIPAWKGLQGATGLNVAQLLVDDFLSCIHAQPALTVVS
ncbi:RimK family alpha-L-glutamate ligase [Methylobacillus arboreus]|uniref:ATP-grasp domain-containing protein n=1 Tax=Methylobacillus arboreus TaxID=755170 RepID=UPI001E5480B4|nr:RimK family alpha-L-glutamate ligase [Methylobacillus arboreus]MCB5189639.1 RimK family alpha-L-glutamate ligase [Methylobacillus arboreus]